MTHVNAPLFSIVTVVLNPGEALGETARSVDLQECDQGFEHIVKDGGSTDGSVEHLPSVPWRTLHRSSDQGIYEAMNQALMACRGRVVVFLNAGDTFRGPLALQRVATAMNQGGDAELYYCNVERANTGTIVRYPSTLSRLFLYRGPLCHQALFMATDVIRQLGGFDTHFRISADHELVLRALTRLRARARGLAVAATCYKGNGFSADPSNRKLLRLEFRELRRLYFSRRERLMFGVFLGASLPRLRVWLATSRYRSVANAYAKTVSILGQWLSRGNN